MVSTYHLVRLLQKANSKNQNKPHQVCLKVNDNSISENKIKVNTFEKNIIFHQCRVCLQQGNLPLFNNNTASYLVQYLEIFGGIEINQNDKYPKYLCEPCSNTLEDAIQFRKTAKKTQQLLQEKVQRSNDQDVKMSKETKIEMSIPAENTCKKPADQSHIKDKNVYISCDKFKKGMSLSKDKLLLKIEYEDWKEQQSKAEHLRSIGQYSQYTHMCEICGKTFKRASFLKKHTYIHSNEFPFKCDLCPYKARCVAFLKLHKRVHTRDYRYICSKCPKRFLFIGNLYKHLRRHEKPKFHCVACNKPFYEESLLKQHFKHRHLGLKEKSTCPVCGEVYSTRQLMLIHGRKAHKWKKATSRAHYHEAELLESISNTK